MNLIHRLPVWAVVFKGEVGCQNKGFIASFLGGGVGISLTLIFLFFF